MDNTTATGLAAGTALATYTFTESELAAFALGFIVLGIVLQMSMNKGIEKLRERKANREVIPANSYEDHPAS
jgi:hypothetical protein